MSWLVDWHSPAARWLPYPTMEVNLMIPQVRKFFTTAPLLAMLAVPTFVLHPVPGAALRASGTKLSGANVDRPYTTLSLFH